MGETLWRRQTKSHVTGASISTPRDRPSACQLLDPRKIYAVTALLVMALKPAIGRSGITLTRHIIAARDMNHDSRADLLFQNDIGQVALWEDFKPAGGTTATFTTQTNIVPELNPT